MNFLQKNDMVCEQIGAGFLILQVFPVADCKSAPTFVKVPWMNCYQEIDMVYKQIGAGFLIL